MARIKAKKLERHLAAIKLAVKVLYKRKQKLHEFFKEHQTYEGDLRRRKENIKTLFKNFGSKRRKSFGSGYYFIEEDQAWYYRNPLGNLTKNRLPDKFVTDFGDDLGKIFRSDIWLILRNCKKALAMCSVDDLAPEVLERLEQRKDWNKLRYAVQTVLDLFPSLKYSYSSSLPSTCKGINDIQLVISDKGKVRIANIARSHSIWLDPIDSPKELFKYRLRINKIIDWSYRQNFVPVMMTLTTYHRWHNLEGLIRLLSDSWNDVFSHRDGKKRTSFVDMKGWVRRMEITINDGDENSTNAGWHPHYHAIIMIPKDKLKNLSDLEQEWRDAWVKAVCKNFKKIFDEEIDESYIPAFREHGLVFSRYSRGIYKDQLRHVDSGDYLAKIMGYDKPEVFGGDTEMTGDQLKNSKTPFDLMLDSSLPACNVDLWLEYALATKGVPAFKFSKSLEKQVNAYFDEHPELDKTNHPCPDESAVASITQEVYQILYRNFQLDALKQKVTEGYDAVCSWLNDTFVALGVPELCNSPFTMPTRPKPPDDCYV